MYVYTNSIERTSNRFAKAFAIGAKCEVVLDNKLRDGQFAAFGSPLGWELLQSAIQAGKTWYYGDHGFFGRGQYYRIAKNQYQITGEGDSDSTRFLKFNIPIKDWKKTGSHILVCPQTKLFYELHGLNYDDWLNSTINSIKNSTDRPIKVRLKNDLNPIEHDLNDCWAVVVYTSASAINAILSGVPAFTTGKCASNLMALSDLSLIEKPFYPENRLQWASVLADNQWTLAEIESGEAWRKIK
jgi:hypothetical protein